MSTDFIHRTMKPLYIATEQSEFFVLRLWKNAQSGKKTIRERKKYLMRSCQSLDRLPSAAGRSFCHPVNAS